MPKYFQILKEIIMDNCDYTPKKRKNCMRSLDLGGMSTGKKVVVKARLGGK